MPRPETPLLTVDIIIELAGSNKSEIVLIERKNPPHGWALPGGFVDVGETLEMAAIREAREETGLDVELKTLLGCYSDPQRDPRGHTVSVVYVGVARGVPIAADDAKKVESVDPANLPKLVFDHDVILRDYLEYRNRGELPPVRV